MRDQERSVRSEKQKALPVFAAYELIIDVCLKHETVIIVGETGTGKSTQIPQYLMERRGFGGKVACTQPRRVAAISLARRVASERGCKVGTLVGYTIRFDDQTTKKTRLRYLTDGMLLREAMLDEKLLRYSVIMLDEAHERSLGTDILFGIVKRAQQARRGTNMPLRIVVMSATLDVKLFLDYFKPKPNELEGLKEIDRKSKPIDHEPAAIYIEGRQHPVDVLYTDQGQQDYLDAAVITVLQIHLQAKDSDGDILVFLTGQDEIESCVEMLTEKASRLPHDVKQLLICPMFAALPSEQQMKAFNETPKDMRKVVVATNIAETSITISGISYVVDTGMVKAKSYSPDTGLEMLNVTPISKEQAWQRSGRAGREGPGKCFRLYTEEDFLKLGPRTIPEIQRVELSQVVLQLLTIGVEDVSRFDFIQNPPKQAVKSAVFLLMTIGAIEPKNGRPSLTELGRKMAALPLEPMHAKFLLDSIDFGCTKEALTIAAMLSVESPFFVPRNFRRQALDAHKRFMSHDADHCTLLNVYQSFVDANLDKKWCINNYIKHGTLLKAQKVRRQLLDMLCNACSMDPNKLPTIGNGDVEPILKNLVSSFSLRIAQKLEPDGKPGVRYKTVMEGMEVRIHPSSSISRRNPMPEWVVFNQLVLTSKKYIKDVACVNHSWLAQLAPQFFQQQQERQLRQPKQQKSENATSRKRKLLMCD